jgi:hypothetical protein
MLPEIYNSLDNLLSSRLTGLKYNRGLVIGCHSYGLQPSSYEYELLNKYTDHLCCMDIDTIDKNYSCQINEDYFKEYEYNVIYMFDVIEHVPQKQGERILNTLLERYDHVYLTTPLLYVPLWGHISEYSEEYLNRIGYNTYTIQFQDWFAYLTMRYEIVAYK